MKEIKNKNKNSRNRENKLKNETDTMNKINIRKHRMDKGIRTEENKLRMVKKNEGRKERN